ncbi:MAG: hypothetical protein ACP5N6_15335, partial [Anaerolineae bacterium]
MKRHLGFLILAAVLTIAAGGCAGRLAATPAPAPLPLPPAPAPAEERAAYLGGGADAAAVAHIATTERMVVRTASLDLIVPDTEKALADIQAMARELGGY